MDDNQWQSFIGKRALLVPTRSLQATLQQQFSEQQQTAGKTVWESPNILTWPDYLKKLWAANQLQLDNVSTLVSDAQARLLWHRVIERFRFQDKELALLNVPQTALAAQRSWNLMHDWQLAPIKPESVPTKDTQQFLNWAEVYSNQLSDKGLIDTPLLLKRLTGLAADNRLRAPFSDVCWYSFDLITDAQQTFINATSQQINHAFDSANQARSDKRTFRIFAQSGDELEFALRAARQRVEQNPHSKISVVVPDLQRRITQVQTIANQVFYAGKSPLELANNNLVFRFSLGMPIAEWSATQAAINILKLFRGRLSNNDLRRLLRCRFLQRISNSKQQAMTFETALQKLRLSNITLATLPEFLDTHVNSQDSAQTTNLQELFIELRDYLVTVQSELQRAAEINEYRTLTFRRWREIFSELLELFGWSTAPEGSTLSSLQHQLLNSWNSMLADFEQMDQVQGKVGLSRALEIVQQLARDTVFLPEAAASPIFISGVFEALGSEVDECFITGMHEGYPAPSKSDPFIGQLLKASDNYPSATVAAHFKQAKTVIDGLQSIASSCHISFAQLDDDDPAILKSVSPIFRDQEFVKYSSPSRPETTPQPLHSFDDQLGPKLADSSALNGGVSGGTRIFTDQSRCAFRAFALHRLQCEEEREAEFGLDPLDRGNIVHLLLERTWQRLQSKAELQRLHQQGWLKKLTEEIARATVEEAGETLPTEKQKLLALEVPRLQSLLENWLQLELERPQGFTTVELEQDYQTEIGGIGLRFKIDRLDSLDDGRTVIIDYKTGSVERKDWQGERLRQPQLPLYALALNNLKRIAPAGIAYARVHSREPEFVDLAETGIFGKVDHWSKSRHEAWLAAKDLWPDYFSSLASDFLAGSATINPIDENTCRYCDLKALCRVSQLRSGWEITDAE